MATITLKGNEIHTSGNLPNVGSQLIDFNLVGADLSSKSLKDFTGKRLVLNIFPSLDTGTCAMSVRRFNELASSMNNAVLLCISRDLPFAQKRFCGAEGIENVVTLSDFNTGEFSKNYGLQILDGPLAGLCSRSVIVADENGQIIYTEQVAETTEEPNYDAALAAL